MPEKVLPFLDRFKHPVFKNSSFFFLTINFDVLYPLLVSTIFPKYYEPMLEVENVIKTIEDHYYARAILPIILGFLIAAILPVIDAGYRLLGAYVDRKRENLVTKEEEKIYLRKIDLLNSKLNSLIGFIEVPSERSIFKKISDDSHLYLFPCDQSLTEATWVKYDSNKRKIYPASKGDPNVLGVVLKVINREVALVLKSGIINDPSLLRIKENGVYNITENGGLEKADQSQSILIEKSNDIVTVQGIADLTVANFLDREK